MPRYPSKTILIQDAVGQARELIAIEDARLSLQSLGMMFYNLAIGELHNMLGYIDEDSLISNAELTTPTISTKYYSKDLSTQTEFDSFDKIKNVYALNGATAIIEGFPVNQKEFYTHRAFGSAKFPYADSLIYTENGQTLSIMFGQNVTLSAPTVYVEFKRQPNFATTANYLTAYIDVPDKYFSLLLQRIASFAETRKGIDDKAMVMVKSSYEQLLANVEPAIKSKLMESLTYKPTSIGA